MTELPLTKDTKIPEWCEYLLRLLVGRRRFETVSGDLLEEYRQVVLPELGAAGARRWYIKQVLTYAGPLEIGLMLGFISSIAIVLGNVVLPLLRIDIEGPRVEGIITAVGFAGSLLMWGIAGSLARRRTGAFAASLRSGAIVALVHIALVMITFAVINNVFLSIISKQPDKVWDLQQSGAPNMRAYVNQAALRGFCLVLPVFVVVGALCGGAGGVFEFMRRSRQVSAK